MVQNRHPCNVLSTCLTWLFSWWPRAFPLLAVRTHSPELGRLLKQTFCTCELQGEKGPILAAILSGKRQELGEAPAVSTADPHRGVLTVTTLHKYNIGWQTWGNLPWWHKKEPTVSCPHSGGHVQGVIYESQAFHACPTGVLPIRMCLEQDHPCMCSGTSSQHTACCQLQFDL